MTDAAVAAFRKRMAPGSYLVISAGHGNDRSIPAQDRIQAAYGSDAILTGRTTTGFAAFFGEFEVMPPGILPITEWPLEVVDPTQSPPLRLARAHSGRNARGHRPQAFLAGTVNARPGTIFTSPRPPRDPLPVPKLAALPSYRPGAGGTGSSGMFQDG